MLELSDLRAHVGEGPSDDLLEKLLDAAYQGIEERIGPAEEDISELLTPSGSLVRLSRRAHAITSVSEGSSLLEETDYFLRPGGRLLVRARAGTPTHWRARVDVTYTPYPDDAERDRVALALVQLDLAYQPGLTGITIGAWNEQYAQGDRTYSAEREAIITTLRPRTVGIW